MKNIPLSELHEYSLNNELRTITSVQYENLKRDLIANGQSHPLLVTPEHEILGGNHRARAMKDLGWEFAKCDIVEFAQDPDGFYAIINGEANIMRHFKTLDEAKFVTAVRDNDPGYAMYNKEALLKYADVFQTDYHDIRFTEEFSSLAQLENIFSPIDTLPHSDDKPKKYEVVVVCANEVEQQEQYQKLVDLGYNCIKR